MSNKKKRNTDYPNGGDGMFFYHKKTKHPAKQISHTDKTWSNLRYTHSPNNLNNYIKDEELSTENNPVYYQKTIFTDTIYTRGYPYKALNLQKKKR